MGGLLVLNGSTESKGGKGENSATHVSLATTLTLQTMVLVARPIPSSCGWSALLGVRHRPSCGGVPDEEQLTAAPARSMHSDGKESPCRIPSNSFCRRSSRAGAGPSGSSRSLRYSKRSTMTALIVPGSLIACGDLADQRVIDFFNLAWYVAVGTFVDQAPRCSL